MTRAGKYLTFRLDQQEFGIHVLYVKEIMAVPEITPVPGTPAHLKGVINLKGRIVPVVDLRVKFKLTDSPVTQNTCVVVVQVMQGGEPTALGLLVDSVSEVLNLKNEDIEDPPRFGEEVELPFVLGVARWKGTVKILLKIEDVLSLEELRGIERLEELQSIVV